MSPSKDDNDTKGEKDGTECSGGEEKDEIDITTSEDITDQEPGDSGNDYNSSMQHFYKCKVTVQLYAAECTE